MDLDTFYWAVWRGDVQTVRRGLDAGVDVRVKGKWDVWDDQTFLHVASKHGQTEVAALLIEHGADLEARDKLDQTSLHVASDCGQTEVAALLIEHGADLETRGWAESRPLHRAAYRGHTGTCELLIRHGADVTARTEAGRTPSDVAHGKETRRVLKEATKEKLHSELLQKSGGVKTDRCKVSLFGQAKAGKSTLKISFQRGTVPALLQGLRKSSSAEELHDPTPGVDVGTFHIPGVGEVSLWDFAGQSEYAVTHSMFMDAENTISIVLYNIMDDTKEQDVHRWLSFIKSCNPNQQRDVILVASHADKVSPSSGQRQAAHLLQLMKAEFKNLLRISDEVFLMNCKLTRTPEMDRLKKLLAKMKTAMLEHQRQVPKLCAKIIKRLPSWCQTKCSPKCPVLRWPGYVDAVKEIDPHVDEEFLVKSTRFLDHLGEIIFTCPSSSDPIIVLKPNWLCTDIFGPMMAPVNFPILRLERTSEDYVTREEIQRVFQDVADVDLLITLLQEFQLCHSYDGKIFIFPGLLTQTMPAEVWKPTPEPRAVYFGKQVQCAHSTDMFSSGFFPRVQTRLMREQENRPLLWRDGAKCVDRNVEGLIKLSPDGRAVNICVRSVQGDKVQCGKMLQQLENIIADVLDECSPGTGTKEKVLSARALKEHREEFYSYGKEEISKAAAEGGTIVHPSLGFTEQVSDLLCREHEDPLTKNRPELVQALRHVEPILDRLLACGILGDDEPDRIRAKETPQDKARELLDIVGRKDERARREFTAVLEEVNPHAAAMVQDGAGALLCEEDDPLIRNRPELVRDLTSSYAVETILNHLVSRDHISEEECGIIRAKRTSHDKARELLDIVRRKGAAARRVFREALEEVAPHLAEMVV
ncbi:death-associated protein kinase 1-like [Branchiostoma floridae x Branchiostoma belcheri]